MQVCGGQAPMLTRGWTTDQDENRAAQTPVREEVQDSGDTLSIRPEGRRTARRRGCKVRTKPGGEM